MFEIFLDLLGNFLGIFLDDFFGAILRNFFGEIFLEDFFGRNSLFTLLKLFESERDGCFCQNFVSLEKEGKKLDP